MAKTLNAIIQLRRDSETNFEKIKNSFIPANGEIVLVDTSNGLRAKVGTGTIAYGNLPFTDEAYRDAVINGYYENGIFYQNVSKKVILTGQINKIYVDNAHSKIYYFDGEQFVNIQQTLTQATSEVPGLIKLYNTLGYNIDGTMTQAAITSEFNTRYKTSVESDEELLIFSL